MNEFDVPLHSSLWEMTIEDPKTSPSHKRTLTICSLPMRFPQANELGRLLWLSIKSRDNICTNWKSGRDRFLFNVLFRSTLKVSPNLRFDDVGHYLWPDTTTSLRSFVSRKYAISHKRAAFIPGISSVWMVGRDERTISTKDREALQGIPRVAFDLPKGQHKRWSQWRGQ